MKREEIMGLEPGEALDSLMAGLMGWREVVPNWKWVDENEVVFYKTEWHPSTDIGDAFLVVEAMHANPNVDRCTLRLVCYSYNRTYATFGVAPEGPLWAEANGDFSKPLAICLAALLAVHVGQEEKQECTP